MCSVPGSGRPPGEGNGNPLQCSCLENSVDRETWRVHRVAKSRIQLNISHVNGVQRADSAALPATSISPLVLPWPEVAIRTVPRPGQHSSTLSLLFSRSVVCDHFRPHGLQRARPPRLSLSPGVRANLCSLGQ